MRSLFPLSLLLILSACDGGEEVAQAPTPEEQPQVQVDTTPKVDPAVAQQNKVDEAVGLAEAGRHGEAVAALEALLEKRADDAAWWRLLGQEAVLADEAAALFDRLDADTAIGGKNASHQRLRTELALAAKRPADALDAARKLRTTDDEEGAALWVAAWQQLAADQRPEVDAEALDPTRVGDALLLAATGPKSKRKVLLKDLTPTNARAQLLRATLLEDVGEKDLVSGVMASLLADPDPSLRQLAGMASGARADDPAVAGGHYATAAKAATEAHNGAAAGQALTLAVTSLLEALRSDEALTLAQELHAPRASAKDTTGAAQTGLAVARAALAAGELQLALSHARDASLAAAEVKNDAGSADAAWVQAEAAWHLGLPEELADAATRAGDNAALAEALAEVLVGKSRDAAKVLGSARLPGPAGVQVLLAAARAQSYTNGDAIGAASRAVKAADATGHLPSRIEARLALETYAVAAGNSRAAATARTELGRIAAGLENGAALSSEVAARAIRSGASGSFPTEGAPTAAAAWIALAGGEAPAAAEGENPVLGWARARAAAQAGDSAAAYEAYRAAAAASPQHLQGPWTPVSILDGGAGAGTEADMALLHGHSDLMSGLSALAIHDDWRNRGDMHTAFGIGDDPSLALETEARLALNESHRRVAAQTLRWFAGAAEAPAAPQQTLAERHKQALENTSYQRALPSPPADYLAVQESLRHLAILSYRVGGSTGDAVVVTTNGARVVQLRDVADIRTQADALSSSLSSGQALGGSLVSPLPGDSLRRSLVDIFQQDLLGIGRYLVLPDGPLWGFSFSVLPEQQKGLRFLADIRSIGVSSTVAQAFQEQERPALTYNPDFLGIAPFPPSAAQSGNLVLPTEVTNAGRLFGSGLKEVHENKDATAAVFRDKSPTARFLHMSDVGLAERGGLGFSDGTVALHEVRGQDLVAQAVILSATSSPEVMRRRGQAFVSAGARSVITASWLVEETVRGKYLYTFYEAGNRDRPPSRAMVEAREALQKNPDTPNFDPSYWGQFILHGSP